MSSVTDLSSIVSRLEDVTSRLEQLSTNKNQTTGSQSSGGDMPSAASSHPAAVEYDSILSAEVKKFVQLSKTIGGDLVQLGELVNEAFKAQREFIISALSSKKPSSSGDLNAYLAPSSAKINEIEKYREAKRGSTFFNHLSAISESIGALGWVVVEPTPGPHVKEMLAASQFYSNRVLKDYKDKDANHKDWVNAWTAIFTRLQEYIKTYHTTGFTWGAAGTDGAPPSAGTRPAVSGGIPPPPPPPPPAPPADESSSTNKGGVDTRAALFDALNRGTDVTKGLKKVTADMQTHKNPSLKKSPPPTAPKPCGKNNSGNAGGGPHHATATRPSATPMKKESKLELVINKWVVEHFHGNREIIIQETEIKHSVYIYKCENSTIVIKGKINSIVLDSCKKTAVVFDDLISALDIVNCQSVQAQVNGIVPTVNIDKTDGCQIYLSEASKRAEIVSAKSSEMNILIPKSNGDFEEFAVPEQFRTRFDGKALKTECSDIIG